MSALLFGRLRKIEEDDDGFLHVTGIASTETVDRDGEIIKASAIRDALPDFFAHGSAPMREMHALVAAGKIDSAEVDGNGRTIIEGTVVDPVAVMKVRSGVYKGFSVGGRVLDRDKKDRKVIPKISLREISLVDRPSNPEAVIEMWKADGFVDVARLPMSDAAWSASLNKVDTQMSGLEESLHLLSRRMNFIEDNMRKQEIRIRPVEKHADRVSYLS